MLRTLWFGPRGYERWVKMPRIDMDRGQFGWSNRSTMRNGGASLARSRSGHMEYSMSWGGKLTSEMAQKIRDILDGTYGTDENRGLLYFLDPSAADVNAFSKLWANPALCGHDAPSLTKGSRPTLSTTGANGYDLPAQTATFTVTDSTSPLKFYAPIAPGSTARFAFYGPTVQADVITATPYSGGAAGSPVTYDSVENDDYGTGLTEVSGVDGIEFSLTDTPGTVALTAAILQVYPTGSTPTTPTSWLSGRGHSGCEVDGDIGQVLRNANIDREELSVRLVERGSWL